MQENLKIMFIEPTAKMPDKDSDTDKKVNFYNIKEKVLINPNERKIIRTGIICLFDSSYQLLLTNNHKLASSNGIKTIQQFVDYKREELLITLHNTTNIRMYIEENQKIAEGILVLAEKFNIQKVKNIAEQEKI